MYLWNTVILFNPIYFENIPVLLDFFVYLILLIDINECTNGEAKCDVNAQCKNFGGGYMCDCNVGYKKEKVGDPRTGKCTRK